MKQILFTGDIVIPEQNIKIDRKVIQVFQDKFAIGNLEGPIISKSQQKVIDHYKFNLSSNNGAVGMFKTLNVKSLSLANNHISDFKGGIENTISELENAGIDYFGLKKKPWSVHSSGENEIAVLGLLTEITAGNNHKRNGLNRLQPKKNLKEIRDFRTKHPGACIFVYIHWGYELAYFPQPADRQWARKAIEVGADMVIGHHPHVVQGVEKYKHGYIAYSLGNLILPQTKYHGRNLHYKTNRVLDELAIEYNTDTKELVLHWLHYNKDIGQVSLKETTGFSDDKVRQLTPYEDMSDKDYLYWFARQNKKMKLENNSSRYPVYKTYFTLFNVQACLYNNYFRMFQRLRKMLILLGIHKPYNW